ncbi:biotin--[acetyl-CoA-carboxylase] ligase [Parabacteroides sp. ZJ-118]|uniref:biotin--[acetyl-CoA-carboxylase] ligase n=1 Tax=Parabacteroides sp. ZJ-118 TaxID=2709398 RepID=UPI0013EDB2EE|nr:biotin--[acetyl-CoA-carboxylase] ligase [Parabacteroides sp. ZJ-118]
MSFDHESPRVLRVAETASTNSLLRALIGKEPLPEGSVVVADFQTAGRGQIGNVWESEAGKNLTFSAVLYPTCIPANRQFLISQIAALSVKETLDVYTDHITVKWPNDIYRNDKKICGMLIENDLSGQHLYCSIIGIGINLNQALFRGDAPNPVSLLQIIGKEVDREEVLDRFRSIFYRYYLSLLQGEYEEIRTRYRSALYRGEGYHAYRDEAGEFEACVHDIESTGHLLLALRDGSIRRYAFKEVAFENRCRGSE